MIQGFQESPRGNDVFSSVVILWHAHTSGGLELWKGRVSFDFLLGHLLGTLDRLLHLGPEFLWLPFACVCLCMVVLADYMVGTDPSRD